MRAFRRLIDAIEAEGSAALVTLAGSRVRARAKPGREWWCGRRADSMARSAAGRWNGRRSRRPRPRSGAGRGPAHRRSLALGPELGQCCGGRVEWRVETFDATRSRRASASRDRRRRGRGGARGPPWAGRPGRAGADRSRRVEERRSAPGPDDGGWIEPFGTSTPARSICSARATSGGRSRLRSRRCRSRCAGSTRGADAFPAYCARQCRAGPRRRAGRGARRARPTAR